MFTIQGIRLWNSSETIDVLLDAGHDQDRIHDDAGIDHVAVSTMSDDDTEATMIDASGYVLSPGLADPHVHFRDPGQTQKESMVSGAMAAASGGYTLVLVMPNTLPALDGREPKTEELGADEVLNSGCRDAIDYLQRYESVHGSRLPVHYDLCVCASVGRAGFEASRPSDWVRYTAGESATHRHPVTFISDDGSAVADAILGDVLAHAEQTGLTLLEHCERHETGVMNQGPVSQRLGLPGIAESTEQVIVERDIEACRRTGVPIHFQHVSTALAFEAVRRAKAEGLPITCETAPHYLALCDEDVEHYGTLAKMNPPLRSQRDRHATLDAIADGTVDMLATDHAPHTVADKQRDFLNAPNGVIGLETAYAVCHRLLVDDGYISEQRLIELMATAPTRFLGHTPTDIETLLCRKPGSSRRVLDLRRTSPDLLSKLRSQTTASGRNPSSVNLTVLAPQEKWTIDPDHFLSKARNTPFAHWQVTGRALATILDSRLVFSRIPATRMQGA